jgi:hypothetical protein
MDLTDTQISETADFESSLHLPKASAVQQKVLVFIADTLQLICMFCSEPGFMLI